MDIDVGDACCHSGCRNLGDFLPFWCPHCEKQYCADHRSRFSHCCIEDKAVTSNLITSTSVPLVSVREIFASIEARFAESEGVPSTAPSSHYKVVSSSVPKQLTSSDHIASKIVKLDRVAASSHDLRQQQISNRAKAIIIKTKSIGDDAIPYENRKYLIINFEVSQLETYMYFAKSKSIGEMLTDVSKKHPQVAYGSGVRPEGLSLVVWTHDTPKWQLWNRNWFLSDVFKELEVIYVAAVPTEAVVEAQNEHIIVEEELKHRRMIASLAASLKKGDPVVYENKSSNIREEAVVVGVHHDDFPNIYFTIKFADGRERQTDASRLSIIPAVATASKALETPPSSLAGGVSASTNAVSMAAFQRGGLQVISQFQVNHGTAVYIVTDCDIQSSVGQVKSALSSLTRVPPAKMKLICKGKTLKDEELISQTKITSGCKISMIGTVH